MLEIYFLTVYFCLYKIRSMESDNESYSMYITFINRYVSFQSDEARTKFFDFGNNGNGTILIKPGKFVMNELNHQYVSFELLIEGKREVIKVPLYAISNIEVFDNTKHNVALMSFNRNGNNKFDLAEKLTLHNGAISELKSSIKKNKKKQNNSIIWFEDLPLK